MSAETFYLVASDGEKIAVHRWIPSGIPRAVIQISHGMAEYAMRYDRFAEAALASGYAVFAADHRGHGETAGSLSRLGYLADKDGFVRVMEDQHELSLELKKVYPGLPLVLFGHSFGSFIAQLYIERYGNELSGCILSGTRGPDPLEVIPGRILAFFVSLLKGRNTPSFFLTSMSFAANYRRISGQKTPNAWLSRDPEEVDKYNVSPWSGFICTAGFYRDLTHGLALIHRPRMIAGIPEHLPIFIISGSDDPVGKYGKTVLKLQNIYMRRGMDRVTLTLYPLGRHELLNDVNRDEVAADILRWIDGLSVKES